MQETKQTEARERPMHTPGPWRWLDGNNLMGDHGKRPIILSAQKLYARKPDGMMRRNEIDSPNSRLIAASPELYEALLKARETIRAFNGIGLPGALANDAWEAYQHSPEMKVINAALALAEEGTK